MVFETGRATLEPGRSDRSEHPEVVVIADHSVNQIVLKRSAERYGWRASVTDHAEAVQQLERLRPKLLLIDCPGDGAKCAGLFDHLSRNSEDVRPKTILVVDPGFDQQAPVSLIFRKPVTSDKIEVAFAAVLPR